MSTLILLASAIEAGYNPHTAAAMVDEVGVDAPLSALVEAAGLLQKAHQLTRITLPVTGAAVEVEAARGLH